MLVVVRFVRRLVAAFLLFGAIMVPLGVFSPFTAGDYLAMGESPPTVSETLVWLLPLEIVLLLLVYLIDPKKPETPHR